MCKYCYEKYVDRTKRVMLFCKLKKIDAFTSELEQLCLKQRFCSEQNKYIPHKQGTDCRYYK